MPIEKIINEVVKVTEVKFTWKIPQYNLNTKYSKDFIIDGSKSVIYLVPERKRLDAREGYFLTARPTIYFEPSPDKKRLAKFFVKASRGNAGSNLEYTDMNAGYISATNYRFLDEANVKSSVEKDFELILHVTVTSKRSPHYETADKTYTIAKEMKSLFMNPDLADYTFVVEGRSFPVHKSLLAARSSVFAKIFKEGGDENISTLSGIKDDVFENLLFYIYSDHIRNFDKNYKKLLVAAHRFAIPSLMSICRKESIKSCSKTNVVELFQAAHEAVDGTVGASVGGTVVASVGGTVGASVGGTVGASVGGTVGASVCGTVGASVGGTVGANVEELKKIAFNVIKKSYMDVGMTIPMSFFEQPEKVRKLIELQEEMYKLLDGTEGSAGKVRNTLLPVGPKRPTQNFFPHSRRNSNSLAPVTERQKIKRPKEVQRKREKKAAYKEAKAAKKGKDTEEIDSIKGKENQSTLQPLVQSTNDKEVNVKQDDMPKLKQFREFLDNLN